MAEHDPLRKHHQQAEASFIAYGPADAGVRVVETFGDVEAEYNAIRTGCVLIDQPQRATIVVRGGDRVDFLNRMLTQERKGLNPWRAVRSFWLNRKGRIDADVRVIELPDRTVFDVDALAAVKTVATLGAFVVAEDVQIENESGRWRRLALHGPRAIALLKAAAVHADGASFDDIAHASASGSVCAARIGEATIIVDRQDSAGEVGLELLVPIEHVERIYNVLLERFPANNANGEGAMRIAGWRAYNIARIEAGWPLFNIDFGPESLPHETGVLEDRVSFTKGCYLGQEVVARMQSLGKPKQRLVALRVDDSSVGKDASEETRLPVAGAQVFVMRDDAAEMVGAVTSSTLSPMLGDAPICFAQVRTAWTEPGTSLLVSAAGTRLSATVRPRLRFWPES